MKVAFAFWGVLIYRWCVREHVNYVSEIVRVHGFVAVAGGLFLVVGQRKMLHRPEMENVKRYLV